ncbi:hypothetical protein [Butyrivibrio sp. FC2001]|uniref:hypothetical protein n=1 Tax=Butyrivibrio sp. FC2001 TaxID=1280671 RepID=UPI0012DF542C|nr:hypothetical protein [Butyrivibrio sp. FC2001]
MAVTTWLLSTTDVVMEYQITDEGKFKSLSDRGTILEGDRYEISLKMPMKRVPAVNTTTGEETKETVNLNSGDTLKLMYSDTQSYVDCLTKDNKLVRIYVLMDEDIGGCVNTNGKNMSLNEMFDGMVYAG